MGGSVPVDFLHGSHERAGLSWMNLGLLPQSVVISFYPDNKGTPCSQRLDFLIPTLLHLPHDYLSQGTDDEAHDLHRLSFLDNRNI